MVVRAAGADGAVIAVDWVACLIAILEPWVGGSMGSMGRWDGKERGEGKERNRVGGRGEKVPLSP